jgi:hypothetical protein
MIRIGSRPRRIILASHNCRRDPIVIPEGGRLFYFVRTRLVGQVQRHEGLKCVMSRSMRRHTFQNSLLVLQGHVDGSDGRLEIGHHETSCKSWHGMLQNRHGVLTITAVMVKVIRSTNRNCCGGWQWWYLVGRHLCVCACVCRIGLTSMGEERTALRRTLAATGNSTNVVMGHRIPSGDGGMGCGGGRCPIRIRNCGE